MIFVPVENADEVRDALGKAGTGKIGVYSFCSYSTKDIDRFKPSDNANPHIDSAGKLETVDEERIEAACEKDQATEMINVIRDVHPYEEVAVDIYPMISI